MKTKLLITLCTLFALSILHLHAQQRSVSGKVTSAEDGTSLPGVNVIVQGTTQGTVTDLDGNYTIQVPSDQNVLVYSFIGFAPQEITVGAQSVINVQLASDATELSEVVVTAVGIERESRALGYAVENVEGEQIQQVSEPDALRALQGKVPGVNITGSSSMPGSATRITIRGNSSFLGNNEPLFVVDGIPFDNTTYLAGGANQQLVGGGAVSSRIADLDPNNIESMTVLKGGAAAALYGSRAANGVVLITTKSGSGGSSKKGLEITYSTSYSIEQVNNLPEYQNKYGTGTGFVFQEANGSWGAAFPGTVDYPTIDSIPMYANWNDPLAFPDLAGTNLPYRAYPDNVKDIFETGSLFENSITISGGNAKSNFTAVVSRTDQDGFVPYSEFKRTNLSLGGNTTLENGFYFGGNFSYINSFQHGPIGGATNVGGGTAFARTLYLGRNWDIHGLPFENPIDRSSVFFVDQTQADNPLWSFKYNGFDSNVDRFITSLNAGYDFNDWLNVSYKIGINNYTQRDQEYQRPGGELIGGIGQIIDNDITFTEMESNLLLTATKDITEDFNVRAILGHNINQRTIDNQSFIGTGIVDFNILDIDNTNSVVPNGGDYEKRRLFGVFADVTLGYRDYIYLTLTGRNDWSSTLPKENRSFFYPAVSTSFVFTDAFNLKSDVFNLGKIRASWSKVGNDAPPYSLVPNYFVNLSANTSNLTSTISDTDFPFLGVPAATFSNTETDPNLTPEFTTEVELGIQLQLFRNRVGVDVTVYDRRTTDQIALLSLPVASGFDAYFTNFGELSNRGIEIGLDLTPVSMENGLTWNLFGSFTHNKNVVEELVEGVDEITILPLFGGGPTPVLRPGQEYGLIRGTVNARDDEGNLLIDPANGQLIRSTENAIIGNPNPDFITGLTNTFSFKGISLRAVIDYRHGGDLYSVTNESLLGRGVSKDTENREMNYIIPGFLGDPNTGEPLRDESGNKIPNNIQIEMNDLYFGESFATNSADEWQVYDATVIRLREVSIGYQFPKTLLENTPFGSANISFTGRNLWFSAPNFPKSSNFDPESNTLGSSNAQGFEYLNAPSLRRFGVNLQVSF